LPLTNLALYSYVVDNTPKPGNRSFAQTGPLDYSGTRGEKLGASFRWISQNFPKRSITHRDAIAQNLTSFSSGFNRKAWSGKRKNGIFY